MIYSLQRLSRAFASMWLTLAMLIAIALAVLVANEGSVTQTWALAIPLSLLTINLCAAIISNQLFRRQLPLLFFHLSLLAVLLLAVIGRLSYLNGKVSMTEKMAFTGTLDQVESGPWHIGDLDEVYFTNEGFKTEYIPRSDGSGRLFRSGTHNQVSWIDNDGVKQQAVIGDDHPLILQGYRIYTASHKGFALQFVFYPHNRGLPRWGEVYLSSYPAFKYEQAQEWVVPDGGESVWCQLQIDEDIFDSEQKSNFRLPDKHQVAIRVGDQDNQRHVLKVGDSVELSSGVLEYQGLTTWMGYRMIYDWTLNWIAAASFIAAFSLAWFYWQHFSGQSWLKNKDKALFERSEERVNE